MNIYEHFFHKEMKNQVWIFRWNRSFLCVVQVVSLADTCKERRLLGEAGLIARTPGGVEISTGKAPRERRGGHACKIAKWKVKFNVSDFDKNAKTHTLNLKNAC